MLFVTLETQFMIILLKFDRYNCSCSFFIYSQINQQCSVLLRYEFNFLMVYIILTKYNNYNRDERDFWPEVLIYANLPV